MKIFYQCVLAAIVVASLSSLGAVPAPALPYGSAGVGLRLANADAGTLLCTPAMEERGECTATHGNSGGSAKPPTSKPAWFQKLEDRFYLSPVVATGYYFVDRLKRDDAGNVVYDENGNPQYEKRNGKLLTMAAVHYAIKPYLSAFAVYGLQHTNPTETINARFGQLVGVGVSYSDYIGGTIGVCVEVANGGGWSAFNDEKNYVLIVGVVVHGFDLDLDNLLSGTEDLLGGNE